MPSEEHENLVWLLRRAPWLVIELLRWRGLAVPAYATLRLEPGTLQRQHPGGYRVDVLVLLLDAAGVPALAVVVELQRGRDAKKRRVWPLYQAALAKRYGCPVELLVIPLRKVVASWLPGQFAIMNAQRREPRSLADAAVPAFTDVEEARRSPARAVFSAYWHATMGDRAQAVLVAFAAVQACVELEPETRGLYLRLIDGALTDEQARDLEALMASAGHSQLGYFGRKGFNEVLEKGREEGRQQALSRALVRLLELKFGPLSEPDAARVASASSEDLERAIERVVTTASLKSVLGDLTRP